MNATYIVPLVGITFMVLGLRASASRPGERHRSSHRLDFIRSLGTEAEAYAEPVQVPDRVQTPFVRRLFGPGRARASSQPDSAVPVE